MSLLLGHDADGQSRPQGHPADHACWWCAPEALLNKAAHGERLDQPLHLDVAWEHCPVAQTPRQRDRDHAGQTPRCQLCGARPNPGQRVGEPCPVGGCGGYLAWMSK